MDGGEIALNAENLPLLGAAALVAVGSGLVIAGLNGHPVAALPLVFGTAAFAALSLSRVSDPGVGAFAAAGSMAVGSALVGFDPDFAYGFEGAAGAALFLFGAIALARRLDG